MSVPKTQKNKMKEEKKKKKYVDVVLSIHFQTMSYEERSGFSISFHFFTSGHLSIVHAMNSVIDGESTYLHQCTYTSDLCFVVFNFVPTLLIVSVY